MKDIFNDLFLRIAIYLTVRNDYGYELTEEEITLCIIEQEQQRLSLFHDQIYPNRRKISKRNEKPDVFRITWDKTVDGWRAIAQRSGVFAGVDYPTHIQAPNCDHPLETRVAVYRLMPNGYRAPFVGVARYDESVQMVYDKELKKKRPNNVWSTRPFMQCAVRAEVNALRMAFQDLGDAHTDAARAMKSQVKPGTAPQVSDSHAPDAIVDSVPDVPAEVKDDLIDEEADSYVEPIESEDGPVHSIAIGDPIGSGDKIRMIAPVKGGDHDLATGESGAIYRVYYDGRVEVHSKPVQRDSSPSNSGEGSDKQTVEQEEHMKQMASSIKPVLIQFLKDRPDVAEDLKGIGGVSFTNMYRYFFKDAPERLTVTHLQDLSKRIYEEMDRL
jgi:hypothetical protein